jgi:large subunit ribosomal protein L6
MDNISKKYIIKIPSKVSVFYCDKRQIILVKGNLGHKLLKLKTKLLVSKQDNLIAITNQSFGIMSNKYKKKIKSIQGTTAVLIKKAFFEVTTKFYKKLKIIGVGYRAFPIVLNDLNLVHFKLGYSHDIYFKIPKDVSIVDYKSTKIFISGTSYNLVSQTAALIRSYKTPEPYKGKGIRYENENINLKEGKKI